jgi:hypothetical protein
MSQTQEKINLNMPLDQNFWKPSLSIVDFLMKSLDSSVKQVVEMTNNPQQIFVPTTKRLDCFKASPTDFEHADYAFIRHGLEKVQSPQDFLEYLQRHVSKGFIETASPFVEVTRGVFRGAPYRGHLHNRYISWVSKDNTLHMLPKSCLLEHLNFDEQFEKDICESLSENPFYWNSYYRWDESQPLKWVVYQQGVNLDIETDYTTLIKQSMQEHIQSTNDFLMYINNNASLYKDIDESKSE